MYTKQAAAIFPSRSFSCDTDRLGESGGSLRYASEETPKVGDRIKNRAGDWGTVTEIFGPPGPHSEPFRITVKWDEGIVEIDYEVATNFTLVSRGSGERKSMAGRS
jgi:hypothetical protein